MQKAEWLDFDVKLAVKSEKQSFSAHEPNQQVNPY
jgi:hypothetical protein